MEPAVPWDGRPRGVRKCVRTMGPAFHNAAGTCTSNDAAVPRAPGRDTCRKSRFLGRRPPVCGVVALRVVPACLEWNRHSTWWCQSATRRGPVATRATAVLLHTWQRHIKSHPATRGGGKLNGQSNVLPCVFAGSVISDTPQRLWLGARWTVAAQGPRESV